jgi:hypothetical protein
LNFNRYQCLEEFDPKVPYRAVHPTQYCKSVRERGQKGDVVTLSGVKRQWGVVCNPIVLGMLALASWHMQKCACYMNHHMGIGSRPTKQEDRSYLTYRRQHQNVRHANRMTEKRRATRHLTWRYHDGTFNGSGELFGFGSEYQGRRELAFQCCTALYSTIYSVIR